MWFQYLHQSLYLESLVLSKSPSGTTAEPPNQLSLYNPENICIQKITSYFFDKGSLASTNTKYRTSLKGHYVVIKFNFFLTVFSSKWSINRTKGTFVASIHLMRLPTILIHNIKRILSKKGNIIDLTERRKN